MKPVTSRLNQLWSLPALWALAGFVAMPAACVSEPKSVQWERVKQMIREEFPDVPQLSTQELAVMMSQANSPILLDAREPEEYAVSHLYGAHRVGSEDEALRLVADAGGDRPVVVYCSVGYRSSALAQRLRERSLEAVYNLEGSIFAWANEGRPVYRGQKQVHAVHPYDNDWGQLLDRDLWAGGEF